MTKRWAKICYVKFLPNVFTPFVLLHTVVLGGFSSVQFLVSLSLTISLFSFFMKALHWIAFCFKDQPDERKESGILFHQQPIVSYRKISVECI